MEKTKIVFIHQLRAIATLMVCLWHLTITFWYANNMIVERYHLQPLDSLGVKINSIYREVIMGIGLNFGMFGVAIFFLISGFIVPYSLKGNITLKEKIIFLVKRILRIYPSYICGFSITFIVLNGYNRFFNGEFLYNFKNYMIQCSLLRDWFGVPNIDGISWTLEVEIKFYVIVFIFLLLNKLYSPRAIALLNIGMAVLNIIFYKRSEQILAYDIRLHRVMSILSDASVYLIFIMIGFVFYNIHSKKWDWKCGIILLQILLVCFIESIINSGNSGSIRKYIINYFGALILFADFYIMREKIKENYLLNFVGDKSYAIYLLHSVIGYVLLTVFLSWGINQIISLVLTIGIIFVLVVLFNKYVEGFLNHIVKKILGNLK